MSDILASRLESLERLVYSSQNEETSGAINIEEQVSELERSLSRLLSNTPTLTIGLEKYEKLRGLIDGDEDIEIHRKLLGIEAKAELILLNGSVNQTISDLRTIEGLQDKVNQPEYKIAAEQESKVKELEALHSKQLEQSSTVIHEISALIDKYHTEIEALSEIFVRWDTALTSLEHKVLEIESGTGR